MLAQRVLKAQGVKTAKQVRTALKRLGKAQEIDIDIEQLIDALTFEEIDRLEEVYGSLENAVKSGGEETLVQIGAGSASDLVDRVNQRAVSYASNRAADLVSEITETTRDELRALITQGLIDNIGSDAIADEIEETYGFSSDRAELIAETEIAMANGQGVLEGMNLAADAGVKLKKVWEAEEDACDDCQDNADAGAIDLDDVFPSGDDTTPAHPNCRCVLTSEIEDAPEGNTDSGEEAEV